MKKYAFTAILLAMSVSISEAKIPTQVKKSAALIYYKDSTNRLVPAGTGFFLLMRMSQEGDTANFGYLVTTRQAVKRNAAGVQDTLYLRINRRDGLSDTLAVPLTVNAEPKYFFHSDSAVDLAVLPAFPDGNRYDHLFTPVGMIAPVDFLQKENITEGDLFFYAGMYSPHGGTLKNIPEVRFGRIIQISDEQYRTRRGMTELYMIDTELSPDSYGAPLYFYRETVGDSVRSETFLLAGMMTGDPQRPTPGRGAAVPAFKISELLNSPAVAAERQREFQQLKKNK